MVYLLGIFIIAVAIGFITQSLAYGCLTVGIAFVLGSLFETITGKSLT